MNRKVHDELIMQHGLTLKISLLSVWTALELVGCHDSVRLEESNIYPAGEFGPVPSLILLLLLQCCVYCCLVAVGYFGIGAGIGVEVDHQGKAVIL